MSDGHERYRHPPDRAAILAGYRPIRAAIQSILEEAVEHCRKPDLDRAAKHLDLVDQAQLEDETTFEMLLDIALFEPNQRRRRVIDGFLGKHLASVAPADRDLATRIGAAFLSIFRVAGWHESGGIWLDDLLVEGRRIWLMDESLEATALEGLVVALRVFDAGFYHCGFGIIVQPEEEAVAFCRTAVARGDPLPVRHSLAATLYGDAIAAATRPASLDMMMSVLELAEASLALAPARRRKTARRKT